MTNDLQVEQLVALLELAGDFRLEWDAIHRRYTIWTGYDHLQGWYGKEGGFTLREALEHGIEPP